MRAEARVVCAAGAFLWLVCAPPSTRQLISVGSHRLEIREQGEGLPVVVLETGIGDSLDRLIPLQERIAEESRVVAYNRAGYGRSEPGPLPRHSGREADELRALLRAGQPCQACKMQAQRNAAANPQKRMDHLTHRMLLLT